MQEVFNLCIFTSGEYKCTKSGCNWDEYEENIDYGIYFPGDGDDTDATIDIERCRSYCSEDSKCEAFEWTYKYCSWWKAGRCLEKTEMTMENSHFWTCRKEIGTP